MRAHRLLAAGQDVDAVQQHAAGHRRVRRAAAPSARAQSSSCRSPTRRPARAARRGSSANATPWTACSSPPPWQVEPDVRDPRPRAARSQRVRISADERSQPERPRAETCATRRRGFSASSSAWPSRLQERISSATSAPGRNDRPPRARRDRRPLECVLDHLSERNAARVAEPEERERGLVEDRHRDRQHRVRDQERRDLGQHVAQDDPHVCRAERASSLDVDALAHALHLRADDPRGARSRAGSRSRSRCGRGSVPRSPRRRSSAARPG